MTFREITPPDIPALFDVRTAVKENPYPRDGLYLAGINEHSVLAMLQSTHKGWLCEIESHIVGFTIGNGTTGELWVVAVLPDFEGKRIGTQLLDLVENWLWSVGWTEISLQTSIDPKLRAYTFYLRRGWRDSVIKGNERHMKKSQPLQPFP